MSPQQTTAMSGVAFTTRLSVLLAPLCWQLSTGGCSCGVTILLLAGNRRHGLIAINGGPAVLPGLRTVSTVPWLWETRGRSVSGARPPVVGTSASCILPRVLKCAGCFSPLMPPDCWSFQPRKGRTRAWPLTLPGLPAA